MLAPSAQVSQGHNSLQNHTTTKNSHDMFIHTQALGVRINGLGFYIKNLSEARKKEYAAQDVLNQKDNEMQRTALEALTAKRESLDKQQAEKLAALQRQHVDELQALQALGKERKARAQRDSDLREVSHLMLESDPTPQFAV